MTVNTKIHRLNMWLAVNCTDVTKCFYLGTTQSHSTWHEWPQNQTLDLLYLYSQISLSSSPPPTVFLCALSPPPPTSSLTSSPYCLPTTHTRLVDLSAPQRVELTLKFHRNRDEECVCGLSLYLNSFSSSFFFPEEVVLFVVAQSVKVYKKSLLWWGRLWQASTNNTSPPAGGIHSTLTSCDTGPNWWNNRERKREGGRERMTDKVWKAVKVLGRGNIRMRRKSRRGVLSFSEWWTEVCADMRVTGRVEAAAECVCVCLYEADRFGSVCEWDADYMTTHSSRREESRKFNFP